MSEVAKPLIVAANTFTLPIASTALAPLNFVARVLMTLVSTSRVAPASILSEPVPNSRLVKSVVPETASNIPLLVR